MGRFDGGEITSDAGGILLREVEQRTRILGRLSECFAAGLDSARISGHSARVGAAQSLVRHGATVPELQQVGRWKTSAMPAHYARAELG